MHLHEKWRSIQWPVSKVVRTDSCGKNFLVGIFVNVRFCVMFTYSALHVHATFDDPDLISSHRDVREFQVASNQVHTKVISDAFPDWTKASVPVFSGILLTEALSNSALEQNLQVLPVPFVLGLFSNIFLMITGSWKASKNIAIFSLSVFSFSRFYFLFSGSCLNSVRMLHRYSKPKLFFPDFSHHLWEKTDALLDRLQNTLLWFHFQDYSGEIF